MKEGTEVKMREGMDPIFEYNGDYAADKSGAIDKCGVVRLDEGGGAGAAASGPEANDAV